jgi:Rrf2 family transcriptional regulator, cysteine metabolism repressor
VIFKGKSFEEEFMNVSTKGRYALRALTHLAVSYAGGGNSPVSIKEISGKERISGRYLENIFVSLRKSGIVKSVKGEKGGFTLAAAPSEISVFDVLKAVEKETAPTKCSADLKFCGNAEKCGIRGVWVRLDKLQAGFLKKTTLEEVTGTHTAMNKRS